MLNEWSDREPDPPRRSIFAIGLAIIVVGAALAFLAHLVISIQGE